MDQDLLRSLSTLLIFIAFVSLSINVYRKKNKPYYEEAAKLPFADSREIKAEDHHD